MISFWTRLLVKEKLVNLCRTQGKTCQGKLGRLCGALSQGKLVQLYTRAIKTCPRKIVGKKTCSSYTRARKVTKELVKENLLVCAGLKRVRGYNKSLRQWNLVNNCAWLRYVCAKAYPFPFRYIFINLDLYLPTPCILPRRFPVFNVSSLYSCFSNFEPTQHN